MRDDLRAELIKQFPSEVIETTDDEGKGYYACPTCHRAITHGQEQCSSCKQILSWKNIRKEMAEKVGIKKGYIEFELPGDFVPGNCRKCPLSYIAKSGNESVYVCPMKWRNACKLEIK